MSESGDMTVEASPTLPVPGAHAPHTDIEEEPVRVAEGSVVSRNPMSEAHMLRGKVLALANEAYAAQVATGVPTNVLIMDTAALYAVLGQNPPVVLEEAPSLFDGSVVSEGEGESA